MNRRDFLIGLFGTAAVIAAGPIPKAIEKLTEKTILDYASMLPRMDEVYCNGKDYCHAIIEYLSGPPYFKVSVPEGFRPMREESDRINAEVMAKLKAGM